jgi:hypothetical protein
MKSDIVDYSIEGMPIRKLDIAWAIDDVKSSLDLKTTTGECSNFLIEQLANHHCRIPQIFGSKLLLVDIHAIYDQIGFLEGAKLNRSAPTKKTKIFTEGPLKGLWQKHWFQASFIFQNLSNENQRHGSNLIFENLRKNFNNKIPYGQTINDKMAGILSQASVFNAYETRAKQKRHKNEGRLTGEWIIYAKSKGRNIYLTLATHDEDQQTIFSRCNPAENGFSELREKSPFKLSNS